MRRTQQQQYHAFHTAGPEGGSDGGGANSQAAIVALLRRAAGVFDHMATNVLPILPVALGPYANKDRWERDRGQAGGCHHPTCVLYLYLGLGW
jgi:hypothetical protein